MHIAFTSWPAHSRACSKRLKRPRAKVEWTEPEPAPHISSSVPPDHRALFTGFNVINDPHVGYPRASSESGEGFKRPLLARPHGVPLPSALSAPAPVPLALLVDLDVSMVAFFAGVGAWAAIEVRDEVADYAYGRYSGLGSLAL